MTVTPVKGVAGNVSSDHVLKDLLQNIRFPLSAGPMSVRCTAATTATGTLRVPADTQCLSLIFKVAIATLKPTDLESGSSSPPKL